MSRTWQTVNPLALVFVATGVLGLALLLHGALTFMTLESMYLDGVAAKVHTLSRKLQSDLGTERGLRIHRSARHFQDERLRVLKETISTDIQRHSVEGGLDASHMPSVQVHYLLADGTILGSTDNAQAFDFLTDGLIGRLGHGTVEAQRKRDVVSFVSGENFVVAMPVGARRDTVAADLIVSVDNEHARSGANSLLEQTTPILIAGGGGCALALALLLGALARKTDVRARAGARKLQRIGLGILVCVQLAGAVVLLSGFAKQQALLDVAHSRATLQSLSNEIRPWLERGVRIEHFADLDAMLARLGDLQPTLSKLSVMDADGVEVAAAQPDESKPEESFARLVAEALARMDMQRDPEVQTSAVITAGNNTIELRATVSARAVELRVLESGVQVLTMLVIVALVAMELLVFALRILGRVGKARAAEVRSEQHAGMRPAIFLFLFGIDISMSFVPLHMERLVGDGAPDRATEFLLGLPISTEFLFVGLGILLAGYWLDRSGWLKPFAAGVVLAGLGVAWSSLAPGAFHFTLSRAAVGLGFGLTLMSAQGFVVRTTGPSGKAHGLANLFAGLYSGSLCGSAVGAMLADRMDYVHVFMLGAVFIAASGAYVWLVLSGTGGARDQSALPAGHSHAAQEGALGRFFKDRKVFGLMWFASLPAAVAVIGFLNYFAPLYLNRLGATQATIGQVLLIYALLLVILGPSIGRVVDGVANKRTPIFAGAAIGGLAFACFAMFDGLLAVTLAVALLGVSSSLVLSSQSAHLLSFVTTQALGEGKALGIFRATSRIGQVLGPFVFAAVIGAASMEVGVAVFGLGYLALTFVFLLIDRGASDSEPRAMPATVSAQA